MVIWLFDRARWSRELTVSLLVTAGEKTFLRNIKVLFGCTIRDLMLVFIICAGDDCAVIGSDPVDDTCHYISLHYNYLF